MDANFDELSAHGVHHLVAVGAAARSVFSGIEVCHGLGLDAVRDELGILLDRADAHAPENVFKLLLSAVSSLDFAAGQRQRRQIAPGEWTLRHGGVEQFAANGVASF